MVTVIPPVVVRVKSSAVTFVTGSENVTRNDNGTLVGLALINI
jgi:hypothetical protein